MLTRSQCGTDGWGCHCTSIWSGVRSSSNVLLPTSIRQLCSPGAIHRLAEYCAQAKGQCRQASIACDASRHTLGYSQHKLNSWRGTTRAQNSGPAAVSAAVYDTWFDTWDETDDDDDNDHDVDDDVDNNHVNISSSTQDAQSVNIHSTRHHEQQQQHPEYDDRVMSHQDLFQQGHQHQHPSAPPAAVSTNFMIKQKTEFGQTLRVVGSAAPLGSWDPSQGPVMVWGKHHVWSVAVTLPAGQHEFKYVLVHRSGWFEWEPGSDRVINVLRTPSCQVKVQGRWAATEDTQVLTDTNSSRDRHQQQQQQRMALLPQQQPPPQQQKQKQELLAAPVGPAIGHPTAAVSGPGASDALRHHQHMAAPVTSGLTATVVPAAHKPPTTGVDAALPQQHDTQLHVSSIPSAVDSTAVPELVTAGQPAESAASAALLSSQQQQLLLLQLTAQRRQLSNSFSDITADVKELEAELMSVHDALAHITAERMLQQHQFAADAANSTGSSAAGRDAAGSALGSDDSVWSGLVSEALVRASRLGKDALMEPAPDTQDHAHRRQLDVAAGRSGLRQPGRDPLLSAEDAELLAELDRLAGRTSSSSSSSSTAAYSHDRPATTINNSSKNVSSTRTPAGAECAVLSWRQEVLSFRHDALLLQEELAAADDALSSAKQQLAANDAALNRKDAHEEQAPGASTSTSAAVQIAEAPSGPMRQGVPRARPAAAVATNSMKKGSNQQLKPPDHHFTAASKQQHGVSGHNSNNSSSSHMHEADLSSKPVNGRSQARTSAAGNSTHVRGSASMHSSRITAAPSTSSRNGSTVSKRGAAVVAGNVAEYQRLLLQRFNELADQIAADLACSVELLAGDTEEQQHSEHMQLSEQKQPQQHIEQQCQKHTPEQEAGHQQQHQDPASAKFAAAHHAAAAAYASGRTQAGGEL